MAGRHLAGMLSPGSGKRLPEESGQLPTIKLGSCNNASKSVHANSAWHDVFDMCKKGFTTKMHDMGEDILRAVRTEFANFSSSLHTELADKFEARQRGVEESMGQIARRIDELHATMESDTNEFKGCLGELRSSGQASARLHQSIAETLEIMRGSIDEVHVRFQAQDEQLQKLVEQQDAVASTLTCTTRSQEALFLSSEQLAKELVSLSEQFKQESAQLSTEIREDLARQLEELALLREAPNEVDLTEVTVESKRTQKVIDSNIRMVLNEIGKIQQALHVDFVQLEDKMREENNRKSFVVHGGSRRFSSMDAAGLVPKVSKKRLREFWTQTDSHGTMETSIQTDTRQFGKTPKTKNKLFHQVIRQSTTRSLEQGGAPGMGRIPLAFLHDEQMLKSKARESLVKPQFNVIDHYKTEGRFQQIAKSAIFEYSTLVVICFHALWLAIETDNNNAWTWIDAEIQFQVVDNFICLYFSVELFIRFMAFVEKMDCLKDRWFIFDSILLTLMVIEAYIFPLAVVLAGLQAQDVTSLDWMRLLKIVKLLRLSRMAKLLRVLPELMIIVKGIGFAARSVLVFFLLWMIIIYPFSLLLRQLTAGSSVGERYFRSVPDSMGSLLLHGILPNQAAMIQEMGDDQPFLYIILLMFYLLASVTILYMLVGVLVDVMGVVSKREQERFTVSYLSSWLRNAMEQMGYNADDTEITQVMLENMLLEPSVTMVLVEIGVDVLGLIESVPVVYDDMRARAATMTLGSLIDLFLSMRGSNTATVKDVREQLRVTQTVIHSVVTATGEKIRNTLAVIQADVKSLQEEALRRDQDGSDAGSEWANTND